MPRVCTACSHKSRTEIDAAIVAGEANRRIASRYALTEAALRRHHASGHVVRAIAKAEAAATVQGDDLLGQVRKLQRLSEGVLARALSTGDLRTSVSAIREAARLIELLGKLLGELDAAPTTVINVLMSPEWLVIKQTLGDFPDARSAVAEALATLGQQAALPSG